MAATSTTVSIRRLKTTFHSPLDPVSARAMVAFVSEPDHRILPMNATIASFSFRVLAVSGFVALLGLTASAAPGEATGWAIAGELIVHLDARDASAGSSNWVNKGSMGNFIRIGTPKLGTN